MSSQHNGSFADHEFPEPEPDFPHAWTFSAQRYVPRPRPVARIILPSHQRANESAQFEPPSPVVTFSSTETLQPLLRPSREGDDTNLTGFNQGNWFQKLYVLFSRLNKNIVAVRVKILSCLALACSPIRKGFRLLWKSVQNVLEPVKRSLEYAVRPGSQGFTARVRVQSLE
ncbi:hypothetical protein D9756_008951 [Leucocoprinus leucothites]|uniref:Uncharacterized protein n=1 Tax=Leucocoprinus leucothites TaxID=201217 RepID=A0A8H5CZ00_9AGAR|nr:hypothetical protein D9756_008951 [Leucoagaricus leucothites]